VALLARGLCRYAFFSPPDSLTTARADRAARIYAETNAPYRSADYVVLRGVAGYGIWWWDREIVRRLTPGWPYDPERILPESVLYPVANGWRVLELEDGFEAQYWYELTLKASAWRRREFSEEQWAAFVEATPEPAEAAPASAPAALAERLDIGALNAVARVKAPPGWKNAEKAGLGAIALSGLAACLFLSGALRHELQARQFSAQAASIEHGSTSNEDAHDIETLTQLAAKAQEPNPLFVVARALGAVQPLGAVPQSWAVEDRRLRLEITRGEQEPVERLAAALEADEWLYNVSAQVDSSTGRTIFSADVCSSINRARCEAETRGAAP